MDKKKVIVIGRDGQLASELYAISHLMAQFQFTFTSQEDINLLAGGFEQKLMSLKPDLIINTSAYTLVDKAEQEIEKAVLLNTIAPGKLSSLCSKLRIPFIHISTDYVYDSNKGYPYTEDAITSPKSLYGITKLNGDKLVLTQNTKSIVIRTSWLYSSFGNNFVKTMLRLSKEKSVISIVNDQFGCPTNVEDLAEAIMKIIEKVILTDFNQWGVYNYANEGVTNWKDFAIDIFEKKGIDVKICGISTKTYNAPAKRPLWSVMSTNKIKKEFNLTIPHWKPALIRCLSKL